MSIDEFKKIFVVYSEKISIKFNEKQLNQFYNYMDLLLEQNKKINLNNISKRLNEITDYLIDLKKETARVVIKQIYYNCFLNKLKLEDMFEVLSEMREETNLRLQTELDKIIAKNLGKLVENSNYQTLSPW